MCALSIENCNGIWLEQVDKGEGKEKNCHGMWEVTEPLSGNWSPVVKMVHIMKTVSSAQTASKLGMFVTVDKYKWQNNCIKNISALIQTT